MSDTFLAGAIQAITASLRTDDPDLDRENAGEALRQLGYAVFGLEWDSGGPGGGAGTEEVYVVGEDRYFTSSSTFGWDGPFDSVDEALGGTIHVTGATREVWANEWTEEELIARMELHDPLPWIVVNGREWPLEHIERELDRRHDQMRRRANGEG